MEAMSREEKRVEEEKRESQRSSVRIRVTYGAAAFLFVGGALMIGVSLFKGSYDEAKGLFLTILPVSSAVISFWFAGRSPSNTTQDNGDAGGQGNGRNVQE